MSKKKYQRQPQAAQETQAAYAQEILVDCMRFRYIGQKPYVLKDLKGYTYKLSKGSVLIVPKGTLSAQLIYKKVLFERL